MRHHTNCQNWGYDTHPDRALGLARRGKWLTTTIAKRCGGFDRYEFDTRRAHTFLFYGMTPATCICIVGDYRGTASCPDLAGCTVGVQGDPLVGLHPLFVNDAMHQLGEQCKALMFAHNYWLTTKGGAQQQPRNALLRFVRLLAIVLEKFLTIHPYMDGNGHSARLLVYTMMVRGGYPPSNWDIDAKQPYGEALAEHRRGKTGALQQFLLDVI